MLIRKTKTMKLSNIKLYRAFDECRDFMKRHPSYSKYLFKTSLFNSDELQPFWPRYFSCTLHYKSIRARSLNVIHRRLQKEKWLNGIYTSLYEYKNNKQPISLRSIVNKRKQTI